MGEIRISIVICTRDRPDALERCLESIALGTLIPFEVVVVDQSRSGLTSRLVRRFSSERRLPVVYQRVSSTGQTKARNAGIQLSSGDIVAFTDDDCAVDTGWLETLGREFSNPQINCVCGQTRPANHGHRPTPVLLSTIGCSKRRALAGRRNPIKIGKGNNMAFRREDLARLGPFNERIGCGTSVYAGDDMDLFYRLLKSGGTILQSPDAVVYHSQPDDLRDVAQKKRQYSLAASAVLGSWLRCGDGYAGCLLLGKITYELIYLLCGGLLRWNPSLAGIGWQSFMGSLSGLRYTVDGTFYREIRRSSERAYELHASSMDPAGSGVIASTADSGTKTGLS